MPRFLADKNQSTIRVRIDQFPVFETFWLWVGGNVQKRAQAQNPHRYITYYIVDFLEGPDK